MPGNIPYIVVWSSFLDADGVTPIDHYELYSDFEAAETAYEELANNPRVITANITLPFRSTDYNTITVWA